MTGSQSEVLSRKVEYSGERISVKSLEEGINQVRSRQNVKVGELETLRARNIKLQESLGQEIKKLRKFSDYLSRGQLGGSFLSNLKEILSYLPLVNRLAFTRRSVEELLRQQYEISARRVKEAAEFADKLKAAEADLHDEINRLNDKIIESAKNEDLAAAYVLELKSAGEALSAQLAASEAGSTTVRELQAEQDRLRRLLGEHSTQLQLYHTAEDRLARLKENSRKLAETIGNLAGDITQYVTAASEKLDLVAGQIQAIGTAADASVVMLDLKKSLDVMTESMNQTTRFVSETQVFFRQNLDRLMDELELYDGETQKVMEKNLAISREVEERRIAEAVEVALARASGTAAGP